MNANTIFKRIQQYWLISCSLALLVLAGGCNKQLELPPDGRLTSLEQVFSDKNRAMGYLNSCYGYCPAPSMERASYTDEAQDADDITSGSKYSIWYKGAITAAIYGSYSKDGQPWAQLFQGINKCNTFLTQIKTATAIVSDEIKAGWVAQAHTLRALYYWQLAKRYGGVPVFREPLGLNHDFSKDARAKFSDVVKFILADCDSALAAPNTGDGFPWTLKEQQFGIMTRAVPYAIKSEAVTYAASPLWNDGTFTWADATAINVDALTQCLLNDYKLFNKTPEPGTAQNPYALYFITSSNDQRAVDKETILQVGGQMQLWKYAGMPSTPKMSKAGPCPTQDLVDAYEMANGEAPITGYSDAAHLNPIVNPASGYDPVNPYDGRDPRFYASIYYNGAVRRLNDPGGYKVQTYVGGTDGISDNNNRYTRTGYYTRKFNNSQSGEGNEADGAIRLFRLAEIYLNFAESANQSVGPDVPVAANGLSGSARDVINAVRKRAGMPNFPAGMSKEAFEKKYRNERRVELAFEEHRFFDVRRWKVLDQTDPFVTGMRIANTNGVLSYTRFKLPNRGAATDKYLMYPIEKGEVDKILGLSGVNWQNPGW
ncbi:RagB/SusD family nutrient uptake outer membrane protein [Niabella drilacis]|uniref:Starch-binding associating with outer membrane n=1 Tax=Niabella drilacis (strain DSM 25811 / CCM 8410 / CCUG 62505 / LMG 26954 / E90) TaxID=1285928 RepID=A0A1G6JIB5_NIADE|nr:RagB/SusD family nutrient uptake outer membrane protein [Niabella drilacis]SDC18427.1 Starch-binding associating with outer membrane [Niabella drilacis]